MTLEEIKQLIQAVIDSGIAELEVQRADDRVFIRRTPKGRVAHELGIPSAPAAGHAPNPAPAPAASGGSPAEAAAEALSDSSLHIARAPIVGTFYEAASPGTPPFVKVGDSVQTGQVLCIIESMKLMNEIEAEVSGAIVSKFVENGHPVEYGEALFAIRPL